MHGVIQGVSLLKLSILRQNKTQGQKSPVKPVIKVERHQKQVISCLIITVTNHTNIVIQISPL